MKRHGNLYAKIYDIENLKQADITARKGKLKTKGVILHDKNRDSNLLELQQQLINKTFKTSPYTVFKIHDPKERDIYKLPYYPDRILHHAIMRVLEPIWVNTFTSCTYACIKNRGIHKAVYKIKNDLKDFENTVYCLKIDIKKYYPSIDHDVLKSILRRKIKDNDLLNLLDEIIDTAQGVPIGNYLSQYLANVYLNYFDHYVKEILGFKYYYRYADDMVFLAASKETLHSIFYSVKEYLNNQLKLEIKRNYQIFPVEKRGLDFLGYRFYHTHIKLRKSLKTRWFKNITGKAKNRGEAFWSYYGWAVHCNSKQLLNKIYGMKKFADLGIVIKHDEFIGDKIKIDKIINREIVLCDFKIDESKYKDNNNKKCLTLQIELNGEKKIVFTGSKILLQAVEQVNKEDLPVTCTIITENGMYKFT